MVRMQRRSETKGEKGSKFDRIEPGLYRYKPTGAYYSVLKKDGKTKWRNLETADKATARRLLAEERNGQETLDSNLSGLELGELTTRYLGTIGKKAKKTIKTRRGVIRQLLAALPPQTKVRDVKPSDLAQWAASLDVCEDTHNEYIRIVKTIFDLAVDDRAILASPAKGLKRLKVPDKRKPTPTFEQFQAIVKDIRSQPLNAHARDSADFVEFMGLAGLGQAETRNLRLCDVDWKNNRMHVRRQKTGKAFQVPIYPQLKPLLKKLVARAQQPEPVTEEERAKMGERRLFFIDDAKKALDSACKRLGYPHLEQRSLRRCFITRAIEKGIDFKTIAATQGHSDGGVLVAKTYSYLRESHLDKMAARLR